MLRCHHKILRLLLLSIAKVPEVNALLCDRVFKGDMGSSDFQPKQNTTNKKKTTHSSAQTIHMGCRRSVELD